MDIEEVIVTAQKVEQNLQDVPASVSVLPGSSIEESGANNISDLNGLAPNVIFQRMVFIQNTANIAIRGSGSSTPTHLPTRRRRYWSTAYRTPA